MSTILDLSIFVRLAVVSYSARSLFSCLVSPQPRFITPTDIHSIVLQQVKRCKLPFNRLGIAVIREIALGSCMSFVPNPTQANASNTNNAKVNSTPAASAVPPEEGEVDSTFKLRTYDVYWVEKSALMYKDGVTAVSLLRQISIIGLS